MLRDKIKKLIKNSVKCLHDDSCLAPQKIEVTIKYPPKENYGDYSVVLREDLAKQSQQKIKEKKPDFLEKVVFIPPSFLNFYIKREYLQKEIGNILKQGKNFGKVNIGGGQKANIEFISANPVGPLHIGNGRGAFFGDVLSNLLSFTRFRVDREYFINDGKSSNQIIEIGKTAVGKGTTYLNNELRLKIKDQQVKIKNIIKKAKNKEDIYGEAGYLLAQEILKDIKEFIKKKLKIKFDRWFSEEKDLIQKRKVESALKMLKKKNLVYEKEGALWLKASKFDDGQDWVLVRKNGQPTYFLSDIAYHIDKIKRGYKKIIDIWGADHQGHVKRMKTVMNMLDFKGDFEVLISQIVNLKRGRKLSKRKGKVIELEELVDDIGLDISRYFYISKNLSSQMEFDFKLAKEQSEKNPVYYIQYAHARICSILAKIPNKSQLSNLSNLKLLRLLNHPSELKLIKELFKFPEIIEDTSKDYQLQRLTEYARNLASNFNQFYRDCRVINKNKNLKDARISLVIATKIVFSNLLSLMGISAPKKM